MDIWLIGLLLLGIFFLTMFIGTPVALSFIIANVVILYLHSGTRFFQILSMGMFEALSSFILIAIPLFILLGEIIFRCGFVSLIVKAGESIYGRLRGQTAYLTIGTGTVLAVLSGAPIATGATLGNTLVPRMVDEGYKKWFACGCGMGGATLATIIPPSSLAIVLASLAKVGPGKLLIGTLVPGVLTSLMFALFIFVTARIRPELIPETPEQEKKSIKERLYTIAKAVPLVIIVFFVLGVIFLGIATTTEAAALGAVASIVLALIYRKLTKQILLASLLSTVKTTTMIFLIMAGSKVFSQVLSLTKVGPFVVKAISEANVPIFFIVGLMLLSIVILGCFMDSIGLMMITIPIYVPAVEALGIDSLWFCVLVLIAVGFAAITPPVGMVLYSMKGAYPEASMNDIYKGAIPFFTIQILTIVLTAIFPILALWLPSLM